MTECQSVCPHFHRAIELIGRRWTGAIVYVLLAGPARYSALRAAIADVGDRMLAERLRELECEGVIQRTVLPESPVRVEYELTDKGRALGEAVRVVGDWGREWMEQQPSGTGRRSPQ